ncbi:MAG: hypothetical protein ACSLE7_14300 [Mycobacterium sp.]
MPVAPAEVRGPDSVVAPDDVAALAHFLLGSPESSSTEIRGDGLVPEPVLVAAAEAVAGAAAADEIRGDANDGDAAGVLEALTEHWSQMSWLPLVDDVYLQRAVGAAVAGPIKDGAPAAGEGAEVRDEEVRGLDIEGFVRRRLEELDRVVGAAVNATAGKLNSHLRTALLPGITRAVGDILVYQRQGDAIRDRVRSVIDAVDPSLGRSANHPIDVLAHSLGGVIAVDMAISEDPLWIRTLVTFGSQPSFFHVCDPRGGQIEPYTGAPVALPESIGAWTNLWEPLDPLAFIASRIFNLHNGSRPEDAEVAHLASSGLWTHSDYWRIEDVARKIRGALGAP